MAIDNTMSQKSLDIQKDVDRLRNELDNIKARLKTTTDKEELLELKLLLSIRKTELASRELDLELSAKGCK